MMEEGKARIFAFALPEAPRFSFLFLRKLKAQATQAAKGDFAAALFGSTRAVPGMPVAALLVGEREVYVCVCGGVSSQSVQSWTHGGLLQLCLPQREKQQSFIQAVKWNPLSQGFPPTPPPQTS